MLKYRLLVGIPLAAAAIWLLATDPGPPYWRFLGLVVAAAVAANVELWRLFPPADRPLVATGVGAVGTLVAAWAGEPWGGWPAVMAALTVAVLVPLAWELRRYTPDGHALARSANGVFLVVYLGLLPAFLVRLRWLSGIGLWAVLAAIFVPKVGDIGAYFTGRLLGRHKMAPTLSPKKTWEGFAGGLVAAAGTAVGAGAACPGLFPRGPLEAAVFGVVVGAAGVLGDLFESLLKRDAQVKDAARTLPGFGGVLDVIDSVLFAAPVAYLWFALH